MLVALYGGIPVATIPANLLAEPAAGAPHGLGPHRRRGGRAGRRRAGGRAPAAGRRADLVGRDRWPAGAAAAPLGQLGAARAGAGRAAGASGRACASTAPVVRVGPWLGVAGRSRCVLAAARGAAGRHRTPRPCDLRRCGGPVELAGRCRARPRSWWSVPGPGPATAARRSRAGRGSTTSTWSWPAPAGSTTAGLVARCAGGSRSTAVWSRRARRRGPTRRRRAPVGQVPGVGAVVGRGRSARVGSPACARTSR